MNNNMKIIKQSRFTPLVIFNRIIVITPYSFLIQMQLIFQRMYLMLH